MLAWETWLYLWEGNTDWTEHSRSIKAQNFKKNEGIKKKKKNWETDGNWWYWCEVRSANARISGTTGNNIPQKPCRTWWKVLFLILLKPLWSVLCFQPSLCSWCCLCDPMDRSPPGSFVHGILQARVLERAAISSSEFLTRDWTCVSYIGRQIPYKCATWEAPLYAFLSPIPQTTCHACWCWWCDNVLYF